MTNHIIREIGGYFELEQFHGEIYHRGAFALNSGTNALALLLAKRGIKRIVIPEYNCGCIAEVCIRMGVAYRVFEVGLDFQPQGVALKDDEWLYVVNYFGQLPNEVLAQLVETYQRVIIDNAQAFFQQPLDGVDTIYTCRKFFGVPDGAYLYSDAATGNDVAALEVGRSVNRMAHILGRFECSASEFYGHYQESEQKLADEPVQRMSALTENLLRGIDYARAKNRRDANFAFLHERLRGGNQLVLKQPDGAFMYPFLVDNGAELRKGLHKLKIYVPTLWPDVSGVAKYLADNLLPLPCDHRYSEVDLRVVVSFIEEVLS